MKIKLREYNIDKNSLPRKLIVHGFIYAVLAIILASIILVVIPIQEKITGEIDINTFGQPLLLKTLEDGPIFIHVLNNQNVERSDLLISQTWDINQQDVTSIEQLLNFQLKQFSSQEIIQLKVKLDQVTSLELTGLQGQIRAIVASIDKYELLKRASDPAQVLASLEQEAENQIASTELYNSLDQNYYAELSHIEDLLKRDSLLVSEGALSKVEYDNRKERLIQQKSVIIDNQINQERVSNLTDQIRSQIAVAKTNYAQQIAAYQLEILNALTKFRTEYYVHSKTKLLRAPINGKVVIIPGLKPSDYLSQAAATLQIIPSKGDQRIESFLYVNQIRAGEITPGQNVYIDLDEYNASRYGSIKTVVTSKDEIPVDGRYRIHIELDFPLKTSYSSVESLPVQAYYHGTARIFTNRMTLFQKIKKDLKVERERLLRE